MSDIKTKFRRAKYKAKTTYLRPDKIILVVGLTFCAGWAISAVSTMTKNWEIQRTLEAARLEAARLELEVEMAKLNQEYYKSTEYQELVARSTLNKANEGETLVVLPKNSSRATDKYTEESAGSNSATPSNFSEWIRFLFR